VVNTVGAGDSAVAGFVYGLNLGLRPEEALQWAVAAGTATTMREGTALAQKEENEGHLPQVQDERLR
jgi:6-phosphofructokinase 2